MMDNPELDHYYAVVMAGGGGTRLWPLSRQARPKQLLRLIDERSLFQTSIERLVELFPYERILIVTVAEQAIELRQQCPQIPESNFLLEPMPKGTASVVGLAAVLLHQRDPQAVMVILTSDHFISNEPAFRQILRTAYDVAQDGYLVTLGISPTFPATGYGYIKQGELIGNYRNQAVYHALQFVEKPDDQKAEAMVAAGDYAWNSGMFIWRVDRILAEFQNQMADLALALAKIQKAGESADQQAVIQRLWPEIKPETIDFGIMERARHVAVIPAEKLGWSDVGSWDSLFDVLPSDVEGNIVMGGHHIGIDTSDSLVYVSQEHRLIVTIGIEDIVLVDTGDVLLVCRKDQAQKVRQVVMHLKANGQEYI